jgi:Domain of unknown function (DUF3943)
MNGHRSLYVVSMLLLFADARADDVAIGFDAAAFARSLDLDPASDIEILPETAFDGRDLAGLRRDTWYFLGYQVAAIGVLYVAPESFSSWSDEQKDEYSLSKWWENVTHPTWDEDDHFINYVLHPYWGAAYYVRAQERGYDRMQSFWYSALLSSIYEFGVEALFEPPSIQDIIVTPVGGALVGNYFMKIRAGINGREESLGYRRTSDKLLWIVTDPLGSINQQLDKLVGEDATFEIRPFLSEIRRQDPAAGSDVFETERIFGLQFHVEW